MKYNDIVAFIDNFLLKTKRTLPFYTHYSRLRKRIKFLQKPSEKKAFSENFIPEKQPTEHHRNYKNRNVRRKCKKCVNQISTRNE